MKIHKYKHTWKQPFKMVLSYPSESMYKSIGPESPNVTVFKSVLRSYGKDTFDILCSTYHFKAVFSALKRNLGHT